MSREDSFACCWGKSGAVLVGLNDGAHNADGGGGGGALEGTGTVGGISPTVRLSRTDFPGSNDKEGHVLSSRLF